MKRYAMLVACLLLTGYGWSKELHPVKPLRGRVINPRNEKVVSYSTKGVVDTIVYDDGQIASFFSDENVKWAVKFTPAKECSIMGAITQVYNYRGITTPCSLWIWEDAGGVPGTVIAGPVVFNTDDREWIFTPLEAEIAAGNDFHIGFWVPGGNPNDDPSAGPCPFVDAEGGERSNAFISGSWMSLSGYGDLLIRAVVNYSGDVHDVSCVNMENSGGHFMGPGSPSVVDVRIENGGTLQESDIPVICILKRGALTLFSDTLIIPSLDPGATFDTVFSEFSLLEEGDYILSVETALSGDMLPSNNRIDFELHGITTPGWLSYDDESADNAWALYNAGNGWAQRFDAPVYPFKIDSLGFHIWESSWPSPGGNQMIAAIYNDDGSDGSPGTELYNSGTITITRGTYNYIPVTEDIIIDNGTFYATYIQVGNYPNCPGLSEDQTPPFAGESWQYGGGTWSRDGKEYMIKAFVTPMIYFDVGVVSIDSPSDFVTPGEPVSPQATVQNFGDSTAAVFDVICRIDSAGSVVYEDTATMLNLDPDRTDVAAFNEWIPGPQGNIYSFSIWTELVQDQVPSNDKMDKIVHSGVPGGDYLVWDPDPDHSSGPVIDSILKEIGYTGDWTTNILTFSEYIDSFSTIFVCCGQYPNTHLIETDGNEAALLSNYLESGGNVYMEGGDVWWYDPSHGGFNFNPYFGSNPTGDGTGSISALTGVDGTITEGLSFAFNTDFSKYSDIFGEGDATLSLKNQSDKWVGHYYTNSYSGNTFGFSGEFAGIIDSTFPNTKTELLTRIMSHLLTGIQEVPQKIRFSARVVPNPVNGKAIISYSIPKSCEVKVSIYDITGREIRSEIYKRRDGNHIFIWNGNDEDGRRVASGVYFYRIEAGNDKKSGKITLLK